MTLHRLPLLLLLLAAPGFAQAPDPGPANKRADRPALPTVTFTVDWPQGAKPQHYALKLDSSGRAAYTSVDDTTNPGEPYGLEFIVSDSARDRIFSAARQLNYFNGNFDFTKHKIAFTGTKTLGYSDPQRSSQTTFNWSENAGLMDVTHWLQAICATIAYGRQLEHDLRYDRLSLNSDLKSLEQAAQDNFVAELHSIEPVLRQIADNPNVLDLARQRARHLLRLAAQETSAQPSQ